jgi:hypothetical protein
MRIASILVPSNISTPRHPPLPTALQEDDKKWGLVIREAAGEGKLVEAAKGRVVDAQFLRKPLCVVKTGRYTRQLWPWNTFIANAY